MLKRSGNPALAGRNEVKSFKRIFKLILPFLLIMLTSQVTYSIDTNTVKYYPLKVGNYWVYSYFAYPCCGIYRFSRRVIDTLITNGHKYYGVRTWRPGSGTTDEYLRVDSSQGNIRKYVTSGSCQWLINEVERDSLSARLRDSSRYECSYPSGFGWRCTNDSSYMNICGMNRREKVYERSNYFEGWTRRIFIRDIGFYSDYTTGASFSVSVILLGSIINGVLCGDTSLTGINIISTEVPAQFSLYQNYPNPFNSLTKVKFELPMKAFVTLKIYDALGKEIASLIPPLWGGQEGLQPGTYEVEWDAANFPSGIYFYSLSVGEFSETRKAVLIK